MIEVALLLALALAWLVFAAVSDWKTTEIPNWLNFSLIILALGIRFFHSLFSEDFNFFFQGLIGFGVFFAIGNLMYYGRIFAGGDKKLLIALGPVLPLSTSILTNLEIFISFIFLFLFSGSIYGIIASVYFALKNTRTFRREFRIIFRKNIVFVFGTMIFGILMMLSGWIIDTLLLYFGILIFILPLLYVFAKSVDESSMRKKIPPKFLMQGDWLYEDIRFGKRLIKSTWNGLTEMEIRLLQKRNKPVVIKQGIAFGPVFLISFLLLIYFYLINTGLWNSLW